MTEKGAVNMLTKAVYIEPEDVMQVLLGLYDWTVRTWGPKDSAEKLPSQVFAERPQDRLAADGQKDASRWRAAMTAMYQAIQDEDPKWEPCIDSALSCDAQVPSYCWRGGFTRGRYVQVQPLALGAVLVACTGTDRPSAFLGKCPVLAKYLPEVTLLEGLGKDTPSGASVSGPGERLHCSKAREHAELVEAVRQLTAAALACLDSDAEMPKVMGSDARNGSKRDGSHRKA